MPFNALLEQCCWGFRDCGSGAGRLITAVLMCNRRSTAFVRTHIVLEVPVVPALQLHNMSWLGKRVTLDGHVMDKGLPDTEVGPVSKQDWSMSAFNEGGHVGNLLIG